MAISAKPIGFRSICKRVFQGPKVQSPGSEFAREVGRDRTAGPFSVRG